jgi:hypothetical protein
MCASVGADSVEVGQMVENFLRFVMINGSTRHRIHTAAVGVTLIRASISPLSSSFAGVCLAAKQAPHQCHLQLRTAAGKWSLRGQQCLHNRRQYPPKRRVAVWLKWKRWTLFLFLHTRLELEYKAPSLAATSNPQDSTTVGTTSCVYLLTPLW